MKRSIAFSKKAEYPVLFVLTILLTAFNQSCRVTPSYEEPQIDVEQRAANLVSQMTLKEKVAQMSHNAPAIPRLGVIAYQPVRDPNETGLGGIIGKSSVRHLFGTSASDLYA